MKSVIKTRSNLLKLVATAGFFALSCAATHANAQDQPTVADVSRDQVTYSVRYSDLDLSRAKEAKVLYLRIRYAAETLCAHAATWGRKEGEACVRKSVDEAVARVNSPLLSQYLRSKGDKGGLVQLAKTN
jgi:UrcA family protein